MDDASSPMSCELRWSETSPDVGLLLSSAGAAAPPSREEAAMLPGKVGEEVPCAGADFPCKARNTSPGRRGQQAKAQRREEVYSLLPLRLQAHCRGKCGRQAFASQKCHQSVSCHNPCPPRHTPTHSHSAGNLNPTNLFPTLPTPTCFPLPQRSSTRRSSPPPQVLRSRENYCSCTHFPSPPCRPARAVDALCKSGNQRCVEACHACSSGPPCRPTAACRA